MAATLTSTTATSTSQRLTSSEALWRSSAIARLSERERHVLALVHVQELPGAEIGRMLVVGESRLSQILSGTCSKLKHQLNTYDAAAAA
jgi:RNA polymerase sigma factor (sigma-70 family)